jgi:hypothetical protein
MSKSFGQHNVTVLERAKQSPNCLLYMHLQLSLFVANHNLSLIWKSELFPINDFVET